MNRLGSRLEPQFDDLGQQRGAGVMGMWVFLATELMLFGGLFTGYWVYRGWYGPEFEAASARMNIWIAGPNTGLLLTSSLTMALAVFCARTGRQELPGWLMMTAALGALFLGLKGVEYFLDWKGHLVPWGGRFRPADWPDVEPAHVRLFLSFYFVMTGLHAVHLTAGIGLVGWFAAATWRDQAATGFADAGSARAVEIETLGLYWHFVDVVWIFLLPLLYLAGHRGGP